MLGLASGLYGLGSGLCRAVINGAGPVGRPNLGVEAVEFI
jgi:hypothetical protein